MSFEFCETGVVTHFIFHKCVHFFHRYFPYCSLSAFFAHASEASVLFEHEIEASVLFAHENEASVLFVHEIEASVLFKSIIRVCVSHT